MTINMNLKIGELPGHPGVREYPYCMYVDHAMQEIFKKLDFTVSACMRNSILNQQFFGIRMQAKCKYSIYTRFVKGS